ncbi:hypothetical protein RHSIM_Rhsim13G0075400 [Rhododendron simsii]|uniref:Tim10-like domain-containing protein n=1 Tax=Rhododendron simsii TaxID=118357 RepID=A0A834G210_RHOSS|nr:hypothetical protein RHSIM_Rhsim13G0075400 [Rhododendron simsii]
MGNSSRVNGSQGSECRWPVDKFDKPLTFRPPRVVMRTRVMDLLCSLFDQPSQLVWSLVLLKCALLWGFSLHKNHTQDGRLNRRAKLKGTIAITMAATNNTPTQLDKDQIFGMAEKEMEYRVEMFNKYKEAELNMGENSCIDRCVSKYWQLEAYMVRTDVYFPSGDQSHWAIARFQSASNVNFVHAHPISKWLPWET